MAQICSLFLPELRSEELISDFRALASASVGGSIQIFYLKFYYTVQLLHYKSSIENAI